MSSGSESDDDYVPGEPEKVSEEDSADEETDIQFEKELEIKTKKRKAIGKPKARQSKRTRNSKEVEETTVVKEQLELEPNITEDEKKREDDLWAMFLDGTDTKPKPAKVENKTNEQVKVTTEFEKNKNTKEDEKAKDDSKNRERRIFEFAGETIVVENNIIKEKIKKTESPTVSQQQGPSGGRASGGLSAVLGQLNKKNQLSTLEKSKLDWLTFKKDKGLEEEIQSHNKGKNGYLDRKDFLERADHREHEIELDLRRNRRSKR